MQSIGDNIHHLIKRLGIKQTVALNYYVINPTLFSSINFGDGRLIYEASSLEQWRIQKALFKDIYTAIDKPKGSYNTTKDAIRSVLFIEDSSIKTILKQKLCDGPIDIEHNDIFTFAIREKTGIYTKQEKQGRFFILTVATKHKSDLIDLSELIEDCFTNFPKKTPSSWDKTTSLAKKIRTYLEKSTQLNDKDITSILSRFIEMYVLKPSELGQPSVQDVLNLLTYVNKFPRLIGESSFLPTIQTAFRRKRTYSDDCFLALDQWIKLSKSKNLVTPALFSKDLRDILEDIDKNSDPDLKKLMALRKLIKECTISDPFTFEILTNLYSKYIHSNFRCDDKSAKYFEKIKPYLDITKSISNLDDQKNLLGKIADIVKAQEALCEYIGEIPLKSFNIKRYEDPKSHHILAGLEFITKYWSYSKKNRLLVLRYLMKAKTEKAIFEFSDAIKSSLIESEDQKNSPKLASGRTWAWRI